MTLQKFLDGVAGMYLKDQAKFQEEKSAKFLEEHSCNGERATVKTIQLVWSRSCRDTMATLFFLECLKCGAKSDTYSMSPYGNTVYIPGT